MVEIDHLSDINSIVYLLLIFITSMIWRLKSINLLRVLFAIFIVSYFCLYTS